MNIGRLIIDTMLCGYLLPQSPLSYYAVFDGHGGVEAAKYAAVQLHACLGRRLLQNLQPEEALREAFAETDRMFVNRANREVPVHLVSGV